MSGNDGQAFQCLESKLELLKVANRPEVGLFSLFHLTP